MKITSPEVKNNIESNILYGIKENNFSNKKYNTNIDKISSELSNKISKDLRRSMKFVGSMIIYSYLEAVGIIYSHDRECYLYKKIVRKLCEFYY